MNTLSISDYLQMSDKVTSKNTLRGIFRGYYNINEAL